MPSPSFSFCSAASARATETSSAAGAAWTKVDETHRAKSKPAILPSTGHLERLDAEIGAALNRRVMKDPQSGYFSNAPTSAITIRIIRAVASVERSDTQQQSGIEVGFQTQPTKAADSLRFYRCSAFPPVTSTTLQGVRQCHSSPNKLSSAGLPRSALSSRRYSHLSELRARR